MWLKIIYIVLVIILTKVIYNIRNLFWIKRYLSKYESYLSNNKEWYIQENRQNIVKLFEKANLKDAHISSIEPAGYGLVRTGQYSLFNNPTLLREETVKLVYRYFKESQEVFKNRVMESFSIFYWIELLVYLPKEILKYFGLNVDSLIIKFFQIIWWFVCAAAIITGLIKNILTKI
ncbi:hypothetical protein D4R87_02865 [bacterium]|nr:MAG: hypothetical protein D4R87_02865 [bacterium]